MSDDLVHKVDSNSPKVKDIISTLKDARSCLDNGYVAMYNSRMSIAKGMIDSTPPGVLRNHFDSIYKKILDQAIYLDGGKSSE